MIDQIQIILNKTKNLLKIIKIIKNITILLFKSRINHLISTTQIFYYNSN